MYKWNFSIEPYKTIKKNSLQKAHEILKSVFWKINYTGMWCIAGGYVRDELQTMYGLPKDCDVFLSKPLPSDQITKLILEKKAQYSDKSYPGFIVINYVDPEFPTPIQFIYNSNEPSKATNLDDFIKETLNTFDWSINCVAYRNGSIYKLTPEDACEDVLYLKYCKYNPIGSIYRGMKLRTRTGMLIDNAAWLQIAKAIIDKDKRERPAF